MQYCASSVVTHNVLPTHHIICTVLNQYKRSLYFKISFHGIKSVGVKIITHFVRNRYLPVYWWMYNMSFKF